MQSDSDSDSNGGSSISAPSFSSISSSQLSSSSKNTSLSELSSPDIDSFLGPPPTSLSSPKSFKIVGDNLDKHVQPHDMRSDYQARSLQFFHSYGVQDRICLEGLSESKPTIDASDINFSDLLPTPTDDVVIKENMAVMVARVLKKNMPFFSEYGKGVERHIIHSKYFEMSKKSKVVCW